MEKKREIRQPTFAESVFAFLLMFFFVLVGYLIMGMRIELMMVAAAAGAGIMAWRLGYTWSDLEGAISQRIVSATPAILIIWVIGIVIATFIFSGSIPMMIYYGIQLVNPKYLLISAFLMCLIFFEILQRPPRFGLLCSLHLASLRTRSEQSRLVSTTIWLSLR